MDDQIKMTNWEKLRHRIPKWMRNIPSGKFRNHIVKILKPVYFKNYVYSWKCEFCGLKVYSTNKAAKAAGWDYTHPAGKCNLIQTPEEVCIMNLDTPLLVKHLEKLLHRGKKDPPPPMSN